MNRRNFLMALAATSLAPFIPSIAASPTLESAPLEDILSGRVPLYMRLCGKDGAIKSLGRNLISLGETVSFGAISESCSVTHALIETEDGSWSVPIHFNVPTCSIREGDSLHVTGFNITA